MVDDMSSSFARLSVVPWATPEIWKSATHAIDHAWLRIRLHSKSCSITAMGIVRLYEIVDAPMSDLCAATCPTCEDACCFRANVWFDFKDLLYIRFSEQEWPPYQALSPESHHCRYLTANGCALPRRVRPFICIWYVCPAQKQVIANSTDGRFHRLLSHLETLKKERRIMEAQFIDAVRPDVR
jgi:hypothetical protein